MPVLAMPLTLMSEPVFGSADVTTTMVSLFYAVVRDNAVALCVAVKNPAIALPSSVGVVMPGLLRTSGAHYPTRRQQRPASPVKEFVRLGS